MKHRNENWFIRTYKFLKGYPLYGIITFVTYALAIICEKNNLFLLSIMFFGYSLQYFILAIIDLIKDIVVFVKQYRKIDCTIKLKIMLAKVKAGYELSKEELKLYRKLQKKEKNNAMYIFKKEDAKFKTKQT